MSALEDNFDWQENILSQLALLIKEKGFNCGELFRLIDTDFNETISVAELKNFLQKEMHVKKAELTNSQLERLYKLMDLKKHENINRQEFQKVFQELSSSERQFNWKKSAIQQIGIHCVKNFESIEKSYDAVSDH